MGSDPANEAAEAFRREAWALEQAIRESDPNLSDDELRQHLDRLGDLFLLMTGPSPATDAAPGADLPRHGEAG